MRSTTGPSAASSASDAGPSSSSSGSSSATAQADRVKTNEDFSYFEPDSVEEAEEAIIEVAVAVLAQPLRMLRDGSVGDKELRHQSRLIPGSSPGKHLRHVHDHIRILVTALHEAITNGAHEADGSPSPIRVDYDARCSVRSLETSSSACAQAFERMQDALRDLLRASERAGSRGKLFAREVILCATTPVRQEMRTTVGRELWFASLHSIHHYALARVILAHELNVTVDPDFGFAPSTLTRREERLEAARAQKRSSKL